MNKENLQKLADHLKSGELIAPFDMGTFYTYYDEEGKIKSACVLGIGMLLFDVPRSKIDDVLGLDDTLSYNAKRRYIAHGGWSHVDNSPQFAAKRIEDVINGTEDWKAFNSMLMH